MGGSIALRNPEAHAGIPDFETIYAAAVARKGGKAELEASIAESPAKRRSLRKLSDDRILAAFAKGVFRAGFNWRVVENKWPEIEETMFGFDPAKVAQLDETDIDALVQNKKMIRNRARITAIIENARWMLETRAQHGSVAGFLDAWPSTDLIGLWALLQDEASRVGGTTGPYVLRELGKDSFLPTGSVLGAMVAHGVLDRPTTSKSNMRTLQAVFNRWQAQTGRSFSELSRIVARSADS